MRRLQKINQAEDDRANLTKPIHLSSDDALSTDIELVMAYDAIIPSEIFCNAVRHALSVFPHLLSKQIQHSSMTGKYTVRDLEAMPLAEQSTCFIPEKEPPFLFAARCTQLVDIGLTILGIRVSHALVDGTGLALFLMHATASIRKISAPKVFHDRIHSLGRSTCDVPSCPHGYSAEDSSHFPDTCAMMPPTIFAIEVALVKSIFHSPSLQDSKLTLAAWLCSSLRNHFDEVAMWCDARGLNEIPATYTGNVGCYLHVSMGDADALKSRLKAISTRKGFQLIAATHAQLKQAEAAGKMYHWQGLRQLVLQLNLVPHVIIGTDFGFGLPVYAMLLSRNSSGLRISLTPDTTRFVIEACLPNGLGDALREIAHRHGLAPQLWCGGEP